MPKFKPDTGYGKKPAAPKYVQPGIDPNTTAANIAAQQNVQPANTNPPPFMKTVPFKMKHNNSSFPFKSSPAKDTNPHTEGHTHPKTEEVDENAYEKMLLASQEAGETLTKQQEKILGKYRSRKFKEETQE